jgi:hypothetical protein
MEWDTNKGKHQGRQVAMETKFSMVAPNIFESFLSVVPKGSATSFQEISGYVSLMATLKFI